MLHSVGSCVAILVALVAAVSCKAGAPGGGGGDLAGTKPGDGGSYCTPGATTSCICLGGSTGLQTCRATGQSYGPCIDCGDGGAPPLNPDMISSGNPCGDCNGCCEGTACVLAASESTTQCGGQGQSCMACTGTDTCTNNACMPAGTQSCTGCQNGTVCNNGTCTTQIDPNAMFKMIVTDVHLAATDNGEEWDEFNANPCPFICVNFTANGTNQTACNSYCSGTYDCMPPAPANLIGNTSGSDPADSPVYIPGSVIINGGMTITAYDYDTFSSNDTGGQVTFPATSTWVSTFSTGAFDSVIQVSFQLQ